MISVGIRGVGLQCALGTDAEACVTALLAAPRPPSTLSLEAGGESLELSYHRIADGAELFDAGRFERLLSAVVRDAVAQAQLSAAEIRSLPVYIGSSCFSIGQAETEYAATLARDPTAAFPMPQCGYDWLTGLVQRELDCHGESFTYNTACTSSANALMGAHSALRAGRHRHALVVGAELANRTTLSGFSGLQLLARQARPFAAEREGIVLGEGIGAVILSTDTAESAVLLRDGANNCDTFSVTTADPSGVSVATVLRAALDRAGIGPGEVRGIKAHGTASPSGDLSEAAGLKRAFDSLPPLSVLKPRIGHTLGACGVNELVLYAGALARGHLPAVPGLAKADPELGVDPLTQIQPAPAGYYLLNHFGFGGNNTVLVLEKPA
ncbi:MAG: beta-ketoacyl synthase N-terminal-like domain-containing protein [Gammaproteobacteria bacterium]